MRLVITGASGFIGKYLIGYLTTKGVQGLAVSRRRIESLPQGWNWISREDALNSDFRPQVIDALIHLEVKHHGDGRSRNQAHDFHLVNVEGTRLWLEWCTSRRINQFIYFSSIKAVYDKGKGDMQCGLDETAMGPGNTPYGRSKWEAEGLVGAWSKEAAGRSALVLRSAVVYGPENTANLLAFTRAIDEEKFCLVGKNKNIKSLVSIHNLAAAVDHLLGLRPKGLEIFNLVDYHSFTVSEVAHMIAKHLGRTRIRSLPYAVARLGAALCDFVGLATSRRMPITSLRLKGLIENSYFSCRKLCDSGFVHPQTTDDGLRQMVSWYIKSSAQERSRSLSHCNNR